MNKEDGTGVIKCHKLRNEQGCLIEKSAWVLITFQFSYLFYQNRLESNSQIVPVHWAGKSPVEMKRCLEFSWSYVFERAFR